MALREDGRLNFLWSKYFTSDTSSQLDGGFQTRRFYTSEGLYDYTLMEKFVPQGPEEWVPLHRITLAYNDDNRLMEEVYQNWDEAQMAFINDFRYYYFNTGCLFSAAEDISPAESNYCLHANPLRPGQAIQCPTLPQSDEALHANALRDGRPASPSASFLAGRQLPAHAAACTRHLPARHPNGKRQERITGPRWWWWSEYGEKSSAPQYL